jgi:hypothetical protein
MRLDTTRFPSQLTLQVADRYAHGWGVMLTFRMRQKNHFHYLAFLDADGRAVLAADTFLKFFDEEREAFIMDYVDPREGFTGEIEAVVMDQVMLERALKTFQSYSKHLTYPGGYAEKLQYAIAHSPKSSGHHVLMSVGGPD